MKHVIAMLEKELNAYKHDKEKSVEAFNNGVISLKIHKVHLKNINPMIDEFTQAINTLKNAKNKI